MLTHANHCKRFLVVATKFELMVWSRVVDIECLDELCFLNIILSHNSYIIDWMVSSYLLISHAYFHHKFVEKFLISTTSLIHIWIFLFVCLIYFVNLNFHQKHPIILQIYCFRRVLWVCFEYWSLIWRSLPELLLQCVGRNSCQDSVTIPLQLVRQNGQPEW